MRATNMSRPPASADRSALWWLGHDTLGPAFTTFTRRVMERATALDVDGLFFLARDGYLLERVFELLAPRAVVPLPRHRRYAYLSRLSTALASARRLGLRELRLSLNAPDQVRLRQVLRAFSLNDEAMNELCAREGIDLDRPLEQPYFWQPDVSRLLESPALQSEVGRRAAEARALLRGYLEGEGLFGCARVALVDVGWNGTIQNALQRAFGQDADWPEVRGLYLGLANDAWQQEDESSTAAKEGLLADYRQVPRLRQHHAIFYFLEIFEQSSRAHHGTTLGYREVNGRVMPILKETGDDRDAENATAGAIAELQRGILARAAAEADGRAPVLAFEEVNRQLERFIFLPTRDELDALSTLVHTDDWGSGSHRGLHESEGVRGLLSPRDFLRRYHRSYWRPGFVRATGGSLLARIYHALERVRSW